MFPLRTKILAGFTLLFKTLPSIFLRVLQICLIKCFSSKHSFASKYLRKGEFLTLYLQGPSTLVINRQMEFLMGWIISLTNVFELILLSLQIPSTPLLRTLSSLFMSSYPLGLNSLYLHTALPSATCTHIRKPSFSKVRMSFSVSSLIFTSMARSLNSWKIFARSSLSS